MDAITRAFEKLCGRHGAVRYASISDQGIERYVGKLPDGLLSLWRHEGLTSHGEGEAWFVDPVDYEQVVTAFFGQESGLVPFARKSTGQIYVIKGDQIYVVLPQISRALLLGQISSIHILIRSLLIDENSETHREHSIALEKLGKINARQMYGYLPILALGGSGSLEETKIVEAKEYLLTVAEVTAQAMRDGWNPISLK